MNEPTHIPDWAKIAAKDFCTYTPQAQCTEERLAEIIAHNYTRHRASDRDRLFTIIEEAEALLSSLKDKNAMISAGETHVSPKLSAKREDDSAECQTILEGIVAELYKIDCLL